MDSGLLLLRKLLSMLEWISNSFDRMYIIIDGLDECKERKELLTLLRQISATNLHVLVTSRPETDIRKAFEGKPCLEMLEDAVQHDIAIHIEWMLTHDEDLEDLPHSLKQEIRERLVAKSQAMYGSLLDRTDWLHRFRWVQCQFDELKEQDTPCDIRSALASLPTGLQETYRRILDRISAQNTSKRWERATRLLTWLVCQRRPLSMSELAAALAIRPGDMFADEEQKVFSENRLIQLCSPLVKLKHGTRVLEFRHFSVKEFLTTRRFEDGTNNPYYINEKDGDAELLRTCLTYLSFSQFRSMIEPIFKAHIDDPRQGLGCLEDCMTP